MNDKIHEIAQQLGLQRQNVEAFTAKYGLQATLTLLDFCTQSVQYFIQDEVKSLNKKEKDHAKTS